MTAWRRRWGQSGRSDHIHSLLFSQQRAIFSPRICLGLRPGALRTRISWEGLCCPFDLALIREMRW